MSLLVIIPCGKVKVWDKYPRTGPTPAKNAYMGPPFKVNREFAEACERRGGQWVILSAKYGFITPDTPIEDYDVTFKHKQKNPVSVDVLRTQIPALGLEKHENVIALGGREYLWAAKEAFKGYPCDLRFPAAGLPVGKMMACVKELTAVVRSGGLDALMEVTE